MLNTQGVKVVDISQLVDSFYHRDDLIEWWGGKIGSGKTYGATRRVIYRDLMEGRVVYVNWKIDLDGFIADQRQSFRYAFWNFILFRKRFYEFDIKKNLHYYNIDDRDVVDKISNLTDCIVYADEGQDLFDSYEGTKMSKSKRKSLTRTRHYNRTLVIISQRPQAIATTARANVGLFHRHVKVMTWPFLFFKVYSTEDIDANNMPVFTQANSKTGKQKMVAPCTDRYFGSKSILRAYNSKYLRGGIEKSQKVHFNAYDLNFGSRFLLLCTLAIAPLMGLLRARSARRLELATSMGLNQSNEVKESVIVPPVTDRKEQAEIPF